MDVSGALRGVEVAPVLGVDLRSVPVLDLSFENAALAALLEDADRLDAWVAGQCDARGLGIGRYAEARPIYTEALFWAPELGERRTLHLGIDVFAPASTDLRCPLAGELVSLVDNRGAQDYGPTLVLRHELAGAEFWSLWGHLRRDVLEEARVGDRLEAGELLARVGERHENGGWPPHAHVQVMTSMLDYEGTFPGVAAASEAEKWRALCPNPALLLGLEADAVAAS